MKKKNENLKSLTEIAKKMEIDALGCADNYFQYFEIVESYKFKNKITIKVGYKTLDNVRFQYATYIIKDNVCFRNNIKSHSATRIFNSYSNVNVEPMQIEQ